ncbi:MAG: hypothetical protein Q7Q71_05490 [Verrucomicrobiota bacterium JB023]|nr:hypothetical protein [Verrucomicrobiota bacterium JB023]
MAKKKRKKKPVAWGLEYLGYRVFEAILRPLPSGLVSLLGSGVGMLVYALSPHYRRLVLRNLRIALGGERSLTELHALSRKTFRHNFANFIGALKTSVMTTAEVEKHVSLDGLSALREHLTSGKGAILVLGHMGNWEILNRLHQYLPPGTQAGGVYQPLKNPYVDALFKRRREQDGSVLFSKRDGFHSPAGFVKKGGVLIIVADQRVKAGLPIPFFGRLSSLSPLPSILARKAGHCPIFAVGVESTDPGHWRVVFREVSEPSPASIIAGLEALIRRSPADYLWLHDRWKLLRRNPFDQRTKTPATPPAPTRPIQLLLLSHSAIAGEDADGYADKRGPAVPPLRFHAMTCEKTENAEPLAARIKQYDHQLEAPLEAILILTPHRTLHRAAQLSGVPNIYTNHDELPLPAFLRTLSPNSET